MGCGVSRSPPTSPVLPNHAIVSDDWMVCQPSRQTCCHCGQTQTLPCYLTYSSSSQSSMTSSGTWVGNSTIGTDYTRGNSQSYSVLSSPMKSSSTSGPCDFTSRSFSLISTPDFHSPSSHPGKGLTLDPTLFSNKMSPCMSRIAPKKLDTDCASRFSGSSPLPSFTSSTSSYKYGQRRYPLSPLSVRTEPFPR
jgi:hypothetical protein